MKYKIKIGHLKREGKEAR